MAGGKGATKGLWDGEKTPRKDLVEKDANWREKNKKTRVVDLAVGPGHKKETVVKAGMNEAKERVGRRGCCWDWWSLIPSRKSGF